MSEMLKPCPFCGGQADFFENKIDFVPWPYVQCFDCNAMIGASEGNDKAAMASLWNARCSADSAMAEIDLCHKMLDKWSLDRAEFIGGRPFSLSDRIQQLLDTEPQTAGAESHSPAAMEGEKDTIVNLIHEHVGFEVLLAIESGVLTGVEDAAEAILAELGRRSQAENVALQDARDEFEAIRLLLINDLAEPGRSAFWKAVNARDRIAALSRHQCGGASASSPAGSAPAQRLPE